MPYIRSEYRKELDRVIEHLQSCCLEIGDWNYLITRLLHRRLERNGVSYKTLNDNIGILECAKLEMYRTLVAPYEDNKKFENGFISKLDEEVS